MYSYWTPDPLPLPKRTRSLYWSKNVLDVGVAWYISKRVGTFYRKETTVPTLTSEKEFQQIIYVRETYDYLFTSRNKKQETFLTYHDMGDFRILKLGNLGRNSYAFSPEEERDTAFLIFRKHEEGWKLFPRTLFTSSWRQKTANIIRPSSMEYLEPQWKKMFDDLPEFAWTEFDKHTGKKYRFGSAYETERPYAQSSDKFWDEHTHIFWAHAIKAYLAMAALERISFPEKVEEGFFGFQIALWSQHCKDNYFNPFPLKNSTYWDGWNSSYTEEDKRRKATPEQYASLKKIGQALSILLQNHEPNIPYFFDKITSKKSNKPTGFEVHCASYFVFYIKENEKIKRTSTGHDALHWLSQLPPEWAKEIPQILEDCE
jgi:uncharacterized protein YbdZ (MbtH family)